MKKFLAFMLVFVMVFAFAACNNDKTEESKPAESVAAPAESTPAEESKPEEPEPSVEPSVEPSSEPVEESSEPVEESSEPAPELPDYIPAFVYVSGQLYDMRATSADSIRLTKIDDIAEVGDVACFTPEFGTSIYVDGEDYADYAILVVEYDKTTYSYQMKQVIKLDDNTDKSNVEIPADGFVVAIHKYQEAMLKVLDKVGDKEIYPSNFQPYNYTYDVKNTDTPFVIDGVVGDEWSDYRIDSIDETNPNWDYRQFDLKEDSPITADYYMAYDDTGIYFAVVVNAEQCKWMPGINEDNATSMWSYTCIQVNTCDQSPVSEYMLEHAQFGSGDQLSVSEDHVRQLGFSGGDDGGSYACVWMGGSHTKLHDNVSYVCIFDAENEIITYEVYLPYEEINIDPAEIGPGYEFSISISINSSIDSAWKNIRARNGGGIIGMNEFSKMPVCVMQ